MGAMKWAGTNASAMVPAVWCMVLGLGCGVPRVPQKSLRFFFLGSLWGLCPWSLSVNSLFSLVAGLSRKYLPGDSFLQIPLSFSDLLLLVLFRTLLDKFEPSWFSTGCLRSLAFYFPWAHKNHSRFFWGFFWNKGFIYFWNRKSVKVHGLMLTALLPSPNSC